MRLLLVTKKVSRSEGGIQEGQFYAKGLARDARPGTLLKVLSACRTSLFISE